MRLATAQERKIKKIRSKISALGANRLTVNRTPRHIYAQVFSACGSKVLASASSLEETIRAQYMGPGKVKMAALVGKLVAERLVAKNIKKVAFDRSGLRYHGRIKALAEAAREAGLEF
ncbi:MAG: 50S ribosomal protein L18 [Gammaproteobacteria bacterium]